MLHRPLSRTGEDMISPSLLKRAGREWKEQELDREYFPPSSVFVPSHLSRMLSSFLLGGTSFLGWVVDNADLLSQCSPLMLVDLLLTGLAMIPVSEEKEPAFLGRSPTFGKRDYSDWFWLFQVELVGGLRRPLVRYYFCLATREKNVSHFPYLTCSRNGETMVQKLSPMAQDLREWKILCSVKESHSFIGGCLGSFCPQVGLWVGSKQGLLYPVSTYIGVYVLLPPQGPLCVTKVAHFSSTSFVSSSLVGTSHSSPFSLPSNQLTNQPNNQKGELGKEVNGTPRQNDIIKRMRYNSRH